MNAQATARVDGLESCQKETRRSPSGISGLERAVEAIAATLTIDDSGWACGSLGSISSDWLGCSLA
ncbi:hypothetical protein [Vibrio lentus]|uniref:hypothetical protein n=1 Tax=Vibrio lentus TaxID=136468 RepID=UPI001E4BB826|nr:hypothetical protein [Vibrio lentus]MCC5526816.1 hypothetical protein [Vibrio lentus]